MAVAPSGPVWETLAGGRALIGGLMQGHPSWPLVSQPETGPGLPTHIPVSSFLDVPDMGLFVPQRNVGNSQLKHKQMAERG